LNGSGDVHISDILLLVVGGRASLVSASVVFPFDFSSSTEWCAGMVVVPKSSGQVRICIDFTKLNMSAKRENCPLPSVEESLAKLANAVVFS
jgi:hypothetical protein